MVTIARPTPSDPKPRNLITYNLYPKPLIPNLIRPRNEGYKISRQAWVQVSTLLGCQGLRFRVMGIGLRAQGLGFRDSDRV